MSEEERIEAAEAEVSLFSFDNDNYCNDFDGFLPNDSFFRRDCIDFFFLKTRFLLDEYVPINVGRSKQSLSHQTA